MDDPDQIAREVTCRLVGHDKVAVTRTWTGWTEYAPACQRCGKDLVETHEVRFEFE